MTDTVSPQAYARAGGILYLVIFVMAGISMGMQSRFIVVGDAAATASQILASASQWRLSLAAELVMFGCDIPLALIFYVLLRPVNEPIALLAALFRFAEAAMGSLNVVWQVAALALLSGGTWLHGIDSQALQSLAYLSLKLYDNGFAIALIPFGLHCIFLGYLIYRSTYLPKTIGVLMTLAGVGYVLNSFALIAAPRFSDATFIVMLVFGLLGEVGLTLWLLVFGVNLPKWNLRALSRSSA